MVDVGLHEITANTNKKLNHFNKLLFIALKLFATKIKTPKRDSPIISTILFPLEKLTEIFI
jgi:hypothetical protein